MYWELYTFWKFVLVNQSRLLNVIEWSTNLLLSVYKKVLYIMETIMDSNNYLFL